ncbi:DUF779 domain-containing protein [Helicobacter sp. T3_23-1059]
MKRTTNKDITPNPKTNTKSMHYPKRVIATPKRIIATKEALSLIKNLQSQNGEIIFVQSGGCCEGSVPICTLKSDFMLGDCHILLGNIGGADFYLHQSLQEYYKSTQLIINAKEGNGNEYSLEYGSGFAFELNLRLFSDEEMAIFGDFS